jgi:hypothetical protein
VRTGFMLRRLAVSATVGVLSAGAVFVGPAHAGDSAAVRAQRQVDAFKAAHPDDYVGLSDLIVRLGGSPIKMSVSGVPGTLSATEAQSVLTNHAGTITPFGVPNDAFNVAVAVYQSFSPAGGRVVEGQWDFRNDYVNGSNPDDVATISTNGAGGCQRVYSITRRAWDWDNVDYSGRTYTKDGGVSTNSPLIGVADATSGFRLLTDHGKISVTYAPANSGCSNKEIGAEFIYEHNQDGGGGWSATVGWGFLSVQYSGSGVSALQKSTSPVYL